MSEGGTYLSLFSGIGGLDLAVEAHGFTCVGQVEYEPACVAVLERHWPGVPRWGDVHGFTRHDPGLPDLIIGGFPCQPVSTAGRRGAQDDDRWLWPEFARVVGELRPRAVLLENVGGLLSAGEPSGDALAEVLSALAALGFDARWTTVRAADVGAPHRRERWFCLATDRAAQYPDDLARATTSPRERRPWAVHQPRAVERPERPHRMDPFPWGPYRPAIERWEAVMGPAPAPVDDRNRLAPAFVEWMQGFPAGWTEGMTRTQALKALGNAVVPQQGTLALSRLIEIEAAVA